ncbi:CDP-glycerol glycerophosphotransferase family protein [Pseudarthrobacter sp. P1]|uniref:CDP-glycerol glycerophosphotransferase family protein n=1 Tax=Pseudarthrobacter sp. P1 TaxID=3418418 RepID=UPI003CEC8185
MDNTPKSLPSRLAHGVSWRVKKYNKKRIQRKNPLESQKSAPQPKQDFRTLWGEHWYDHPVNESDVFYESFSGNGALCNPEAIFSDLLEASDLGHLNHVWSMANVDLKEKFDKEFSHHKNVESVLYQSAEYYRRLSTAKYLINNATFQPSFAKRPEQIYLNTWHGTPLKKMGYDLDEGAVGAKNIIRNFCAADYLVSPNRFTTDTMYSGAYRLNGVFRGKIIEEGYPRIDHQFGGSTQKNETIKQLRRLGVNIDEKPIVLYAPTWKGSSFYRPENEAAELLTRIKNLEAIDTSGSQFFLKVHQLVYAKALELPEIIPYLIPNDVPTNKVLGITDVLVTDYSSIFFDFLTTGRPILFHTPDRANYDEVRGLYRDAETLPGPYSETIEELSHLINAVGTGNDFDPCVSHREKYDAARRDYCANEDGQAAARIIDIVFRGVEQNYNVYSLPHQAKESLLIFLGGMKQNGITTSALNLLKNLNYERFDVSVLVPEITEDSHPHIYGEIDPRARQFFRLGRFPATSERIKLHADFLRDGVEPGGTVPEKVQQVLTAEWGRLFGNATFDYIIDFSGYSGFWSYILLQGNAKQRSVWLHNDLSADQAREINGKRPNKIPLGGTFTSYQFFDNLVSVSDSLQGINSRSLSKYADPQKFSAAHNTIDINKILSMARPASLVPTDVQLSETISVDSLEAAVSQLRAIFPSKDVKAELNRFDTLDRILPNELDVTTFITAGRLSPEKNHERLIRAFSIVYRENSNIRLIIMGDGPLKSRLKSLVSELGLSDSVFLAGQIRNPYEIMARADCFILSSDYEGQPMVILEAMTLGLPVITVEFGAARSSVNADQGVVVSRSVYGLVEGIRSFLSGDIGAPIFDPVAYNASAIREFEKAIGAGVRVHQQPALT